MKFLEFFLGIFQNQNEIDIIFHLQCFFSHFDQYNISMLDKAISLYDTIHVVPDIIA